MTVLQPQKHEFMRVEGIMLTTQEEVQLLTNLLTDDDDWISRRLLEIHYEDQNASVARINTSSPVEQ